MAMTKLLLVLGALCWSGCLWANEKSQAVYGFDARAMLDPSGNATGGQLGADGGMAGLNIHAEGAVHGASRAGDPRTYRAVALGLGLRLSLLGMLATDHRLERYFDVGGEAGAAVNAALGVPPHDIAGVGSGWYGAWVEVGTASTPGGGYVALVGGVRREAYADPYFDQTQVLVGLAWRHREVAGPLHLHD
jgi:hypothetical protein